MKRLAVLLALVFITGAVAGQASNNTRPLAGFSLDNIPAMQDEFNQNTDKLPGIARSLIGDQRINVEITRSEGEDVVLGVVTDGVKIAKINDTKVEDPTLEVSTSRATVTDILKSEKPAQTLRDKLRSGEIDYQVHGAFNKLKFFFVRLFAGF
ncbi:MAG: hypothetical protein ABEJ69_00255 [Candidatus Nanohaloarchaea archaeon]